MDNISVINAITNYIKNGTEESCDIKVYDVNKCFDALWSHECINTLYELGVNNDNLVLLYEETKDTMIAIKRANGLTERKPYKMLSCKDQYLVQLCVQLLWIKKPKYFKVNHLLLISITTL